MFMSRSDIACLACVAVALLQATASAWADDLEARAYSLAPVGTNFVVANLTKMDGEVLLDSAGPIKDLQAELDLYGLAYVHTFAMADHFASASVILPYAEGEFSGVVKAGYVGLQEDTARAVERQGLGDLRFRLGLSLLGETALSVQQFAAKEPSTYLGASVTVVAPTGRYNPDYLINLGANRWAIKPELGISRKFGDWFAEGSAGLWWYGDNDEFLNNKTRSQDPLRVFQLHGGYSFRPGLWVSLGATYAEGGQTEVDGVAKDDFQENSRYGAAMGIPFSQHWSGRAGWSSGLATRTGGDFDVLSFSLLYHWFD